MGLVKLKPISKVRKLSKIETFDTYGRVTYRFATGTDCELLGELNHQLIRDEGHRNRMTPLELTARIKVWITEEYRAVIFQKHERLVGYCLFRQGVDEIYIRQLFIVRDQRRKGYGREAITILREEIWPKGLRLVVEVLVANAAAVKFWRAVEFNDYALTLEFMPEAGGGN